MIKNSASKGLSFWVLPIGDFLSELCPCKPPIYKSANAQIFSHYESANKLPRKRNIDRYRKPQQR